MIKKRKLTVIVMCIVLIVSSLALAGCGDSEKLAGSKYVGTWEAVDASYAGIEMKADEIFADGFTLVFKEDGTVEMSVEGDTQTSTWEETEKGIKLAGNEEFELKGDENKLTLDYSGVIVNFEKK